jgi:hypothetical protein
MDWLKGNFTGNPTFHGENHGFRLRFSPTNQSSDYHILPFHHPSLCLACAGSSRGRSKKLGGEERLALIMATEIEFLLVICCA